MHSLNEAIQYSLDDFLLKHINSITYYNNGQVESTNKIIVTLIIDQTNWDEHLTRIFLVYTILLLELQDIFLSNWYMDCFPYC
jgi:hypothetical protein